MPSRGPIRRNWNKPLLDCSAGERLAKPKVHGDFDVGTSEDVTNSFSSVVQWRSACFKTLLDLEVLELEEDADALKLSGRGAAGSKVQVAAAHGTATTATTSAEVGVLLHQGGRDLKMIWNAIPPLLSGWPPATTTQESGSSSPRWREKSKRYQVGMWTVMGLLFGAFVGAVWGRDDFGIEWETGEVNFRPSLLITIGAMMQVLGLCSRIGAILTTGSIAGFSRRTIILQAVGYTCRSLCTAHLQGYVPTDATGEFLYPSLDMLSACLSYCLLYLMYFVPRFIYRPVIKCNRNKTKSGRLSAAPAPEPDQTFAADDTFPILPLFLVSLAVSHVVKPSLNRSYAFDFLWTMSVSLDAASVLPQLRVMKKRQEENKPVNPLAAHCFTFWSASRIYSFTFFVGASQELRYDFNTDEDDDSFNWAGNGVVFLHAAQVVLMVEVIHQHLRALREQLRAAGGALNIDVLAPDEPVRL
mmetsp:Transcript_16441/g.40661  ORF Transcript_16441/g.40661 Transcript_16441/m.40661 type:complete len:471 (+) Transcript_16441:243-1655(+)